MRRSIKDWPVRATQCATCVFLTDVKGRYVQEDLARKVETRLLQCSQICHHPRVYGKKETELCRGTRDRQLVLMHRMGVISEASDAAWNAKRRELE